MNTLRLVFYFFFIAMFFCSCAGLENLTDDRTRAEDDEMYWNGKELFYDNAMSANGSAFGDDYYDPNSVTRSNSVNGGTNPRAAFNPLCGWQLSYGLNAFSNYSNGYGMGFGSYNSYNNAAGWGNYGNSSFGYNPYGYNTYGYNPYSSYNSYGGYGYNPYGYGMGGLSWGGFGYGQYGNGSIGNNNGWGGNTGSAETSNITHHHRRPASVSSGNSSTYNRGVLQKNLIEPISEKSRTPNSVVPIRSNVNSNYNNPTYSRPSSEQPTYNSSSRSMPASTPGHSRPTSNSSSPKDSRPSHSAPSRPAQNNPSHSSPSRSTSSPIPSSPSRSTAPGKRP